jgi:hypothetical protein
MSDVQVKPVTDKDLENFGGNNDTISMSQQNGDVQEDNLNQVNVTPDKTDDKDHQDAMIKKAEDGTDPNKLLAGKYKTEADLNNGILEALKAKHGGDMEKAYKELAGNLSSDSDVNDKSGSDSNSDANERQTNSTEKANEDTTEKANEDTTEDSADENLGDLTPHMNQFVQEFNDGGLSDDSYEKLNAAGYDKPTVDTFLKGVQATQNEMFDKVGGKENYQTMLSWAADNLSDSEIDLFNEDINSGDMARMNRGIDTLAGRYVKEKGGFKPTKRLSPEGGEINQGTNGYESLEQMKTDMKNPLYQTDPAF